MRSAKPSGLGNLKKHKQGSAKKNARLTIAGTTSAAFRSTFRSSPKACPAGAQGECGDELDQQIAKQKRMTEPHHVLHNHPLASPSAGLLLDGGRSRGSRPASIVGLLVPTRRRFVTVALLIG